MKQNSSLLSKLDKFKSLNWSQRWWVLISIFKLTYAVIRIRYSGFPWVKQKIRMHSRTEKKGAYELTLPKQLHESVRLASRCLPFQAECLPKSIVLADMLYNRNILAEIKLGVSHNQSALAGHAWVVVAGSSIAESADVDAKFVKLEFD